MDSAPDIVQMLQMYNYGRVLNANITLLGGGRPVEDVGVVGGETALVSITATRLTAD
jgi:hypothetical protein